MTNTSTSSQTRYGNKVVCNKNHDLPNEQIITNRASPARFNKSLTLLITYVFMVDAIKQAQQEVRCLNNRTGPLAKKLSGQKKKCSFRVRALRSAEHPFRAWQKPAQPKRSKPSPRYTRVLGALHLFISPTWLINSQHFHSGRLAGNA